MTTHHRRHTSVLYPGSADQLSVGQAHDECLPNRELDSFFEGLHGEWFENPEFARQLQMGNSSAAAYLAKLRVTRLQDEAPRPFPDKLGTPEWYDARHADHLRRHGGDPPPPSYYLDYGKKYCLRFSEELFPQLSKAGQAWVVSTRMHLQLLLERKMLENPDEYARVECDDDAFTNMAYGTHEMAYLRGGILDLPAADLFRIAATPDLSDLATLPGIRQVRETARPVTGRKILDLVEDVVLPRSRAGANAWWAGDPDAHDVPFQHLPELSRESAPHLTKEEP